ncbi:MAG: hypothetical protein WBJ21_07885 [Burkholderiaceae bacterium]
MKASLMRLGILLCLLLSAQAGSAAKLIVLDARGGGLKSGMSIDSSAALTLKEGERVTVIGPDGSSATIKGPFSGPPMPKAAASADPGKALSALVATRDARSKTVGVIRAGTDVVRIPDTWLIDVSRPGPRCLKQGERPVWWRPDVAKAGEFTVFPVDRSWRADFVWQAGQERQAAPALSRFDESSVFFIRQGEQEFAISINIIPKGLENDLILSSWLLEKGCLQQADALLASLRDSAK